MKTLNTIQNRVLMAKAYETTISAESNTYLMIGRPLEWSSNDKLIPNPTETTNSLFEVYRNSVGLKKITGADLNLVVPRVDWSNNTVYSEYTENVELFSYIMKEQITGNVNVASSTLTVNGNSTLFSSNLSVGDFIYIPGDGIFSSEVTKEVVNIVSNQELLINSSFSASYTENLIYKITNTYPYYANQFYVRNVYDQVFKCLLNNSGAASTVMPEIDIGGQLPENSYILTSDGYKWRYLYTIPAGLKEKFFTSEWMPVINDGIVNDSAVDGRIDIVKIISGGSGYIGGGTSTSANIISIIGDGVSANLTADVTNGVITDVNILNGGSNYTRASIEIDNTLGGNGANLVVVLSPMGGHGFDSEKELGATHLMICAELDGDELGKFPTENQLQNFDYRQISIIKNIKDSDGNIANDTRYRSTYVLEITEPSNRFNLDDRVFQSPAELTINDATFTGSLVFWDEGARQVWINNTDGTIVAGQQLRRSTSPEISVNVIDIIEPEIELYSGDILYIKNNAAITRDDDQIEQIKIVVSF